MRSNSGAAPALCAACCALVACAQSNANVSASSEPSLDAGASGVHPTYQPSALPLRFGDVPWPDDAYLDESGHVSVRDIPSEASGSYAVELADAMSDLDGFGIRPTVYFRFDGALDAASLPHAPEDTARPDASVFLIDADTSSPDAYKRIPVEVHYDARSMEVRLRPGGFRALVPGRRYAAVVTRAVKGADGHAIAAAPAFARVRDPDASTLDPAERAASAEYGPVLETLAKAGLPRARIAAMAVFHVQTVRADLTSAREIVRAQTDKPLPALMRAVGGADLDAVLGTPPAGAVGLDHGGPHDHIGWMVQGSFTSPNLLSPRNAVHGAFRRTVAGDLRVRRVGDVYFTLWLPRGVLAAAALPLAIVQHGLGRERSDSLPVANALAASGYAVIAIDAPFHGLRAHAAVHDETNRFTAAQTPDGFGDDSGDFAGVTDEAGELSPLHPFYYRDAVRQGVIDLMSLVALLEQGDWSGLTDLDPAFAGLKLQRDSFPFVGFDLGAEMGMLLSSYEPNVGAIVLAFVGGMTIDAWIDSPARPQLTDALLTRLGHAPETIDFTKERPLEWPDLDAWRTLTDRACALAHAPALQRLPRSVLQLMARDDESVHNASTETLASALGAEISGGDPNYVLDLPVHGLKPGVTRSGNVQVDGGSVTRVLYVLDPATHDALITEHGEQRYQLPLARPFTPRKPALAVDNPTAATLMQVAFFFESYRACHADTPSAICPASVQAPPASVQQ